MQQPAWPIIPKLMQLVSKCGAHVKAREATVTRKLHARTLTHPATNLHQTFDSYSDVRSRRDFSTPTSSCITQSFAGVAAIAASSGMLMQQIGRLDFANEAVDAEMCVARGGIVGPKPSLSPEPVAGALPPFATLD